MGFDSPDLNNKEENLATDDVILMSVAILGLANDASVTLSDHQFERLIGELQHNNDSIRYCAALALDKLADKRAVEPFIAALEDTNQAVRCNAIHALGKLSDKRAISSLLKLTKILPDAEYNTENILAAISLVELGESSVVPLLVKALAIDDDNLKELISETIVKSSISTLFLEPLLKTLKDGNTQARGGAATVLGKLGSRSAVEPLIYALQESDSYVLDCAISALGELGDEAAIEPLRNLLLYENDNTKLYATRSIAQIGGEKAIKELLQILNTPANNQDTYAAKISANLRFTAIEGLGEIGNLDCIDVLLKIYHSDQSVTLGGAKIRVAAAHAIQKIEKRYQQ